MTTLDHAARTNQDALLAHYQRFLMASRARVMRPLLIGAFGGAGSDSCHVLDAKYEPGRHALVLYSLGARLLRGVVSMDDNPGDGVWVSPGIRVSCFPLDPQIPTLAEIADAGVFGRELSAAVGTPLVHPRLRLLRYRPGRRATFGITLGQRDDGRTTPVRTMPIRTMPIRTMPIRYVAKVYHDPGKAAAVAAEGRTLVAEHHADPALELAPIVAHLPDLSVVVQRHISGTELDCTLRARASMPADHAQGAMARSAKALASLHTRSVPHGRVRSIDRELDRFVARSQAVTAVSPGPGKALLDLAYRLRNLRSLVPEGPVALVHGDCKPSQFMLQPQRVVLLDLDHCGLADPAYDIGNFLATMRQLAVREAQGRTGAVHVMTWAERLGTSFVEAYSEATTDDRDAARDLRCRVSWYEGVALERKALRSFARAPLSPLPIALVNEAHRRLDADFEGAR